MAEPILPRWPPPSLPPGNSSLYRVVTVPLQELGRRLLRACRLAARRVVCRCSPQQQGAQQRVKRAIKGEGGKERGTEWEKGEGVRVGEDDSGLVILSLHSRAISA